MRTGLWTLKIILFLSYPLKWYPSWFLSFLPHLCPTPGLRCSTEVSLQFTPTWLSDKYLVITLLVMQQVAAACLAAGQPDGKCETQQSAQPTPRAAQAPAPWASQQQLHGQAAFHQGQAAKPLYCSRLAFTLMIGSSCCQKAHHACRLPLKSFGVRRARLWCWKEFLNLVI